MSKEEKNKILYEMQMYEYQAKQMQNAVKNMENALQELFMAKEAISNLEKGKSALLPLGAGVFAKVEIKDSETVISGISQGLFSEQNSKEVLEKIDKEIEIYTQELNKGGQEFQKIVKKLNELNKQAKELQ